MASIFQDDTKSIPKNDSRVVRVPFDKEDIGARKSHIKGLAAKNNYGIQHIKGS